MNKKKNFYLRINKNISISNRHELSLINLKRFTSTHLLILRLKTMLLKDSRRGFNCVEYKCLAINPNVDLEAIRAYFNDYFYINIEETNFSKLKKKKLYKVININIKTKDIL